MFIKLISIFFLNFILSCNESAIPTAPENKKEEIKNPQSQASLGLVGDSSDISTATQSGIVLMGGSRDVDTAIQWMIKRSGGGDAVVIRASGTDAYNQYMFDLGNLNSVETLKIDSRDLANDEETANTIRNAEMLFIAGGDQSKYAAYWKNTKTMVAINYLLNEKKVPVGGTSAGCAILGNFYFTGENGSAVSEEVLADPYHSTVTLGRDDFLKAPFLENVITDQHFSQRSREGRLVVFLARIQEDYEKNAQGIGVDEKTAVCIDEKGNAKVFGVNNAFFIQTFSGKIPEEVTQASPLKWDHEGKAVLAYKIHGSPSGNGNFNVQNFEKPNASGGEYFWWSAINNDLNIKNYNQ